MAAQVSLESQKNLKSSEEGALTLPTIKPLFKQLKRRAVYVTYNSSEQDVSLSDIEIKINR